MDNPSLNFSLSCIFPKGNWIISIFILNCSYKPMRVQKAELDPKAPKKVLLIATPKDETQVF
jgi:hypothetical protein